MKPDFYFLCCLFLRQVIIQREDPFKNDRCHKNTSVHKSLDLYNRMFNATYSATVRYGHVSVSDFPIYCTIEVMFISWLESYLYFLILSRSFSIHFCFHLKACKESCLAANQFGICGCMEYKFPVDKEPLCDITNRSVSKCKQLCAGVMGTRPHSLASRHCALSLFSQGLTICER